MKLALVSLNDNSPDAPFGLCYMAAYLRKYLNFNNTIIVDMEDPMKRIRKEKPDVVGVSATSILFARANDLAGKIKSEFGIPTIIGGVHITALPNQFEKSNFDIAAIGEGEQTLLELVQTFENGGFVPEKLKKINGIMFRNNGSVERTPPRAFITQLDSIPYPAWDLLDMGKYLSPRASLFRGELASTAGILTSRGCPYNCVFCASKFWERNTRVHSAEYVVGQIKELVEKYKVDHIIVWDDLFVIDKKRIKEIHKLIISEKINEKVAFIANGRANILDEDICRMLSEMNVKFISMGLESGSPKVLKYLKQNSVTVEQNVNAVALCNKYGIKVNGFLVMGAPMETEEDLQMTMDFVKNNKLDSFSVFQLIPFPNTAIWHYAKEKGIVSDDMADFSYAQLIERNFKPEMVMSEHLDAETMKKWYFRFVEESEKRNYRKLTFKIRYIKYLFNPRFLSKIASNGGEVMRWVMHNNALTKAVHRQTAQEENK